MRLILLLILFFFTFFAADAQQLSYVGFPDRTVETSTLSDTAKNYNSTSLTSTTDIPTKNRRPFFLPRTTTITGGTNFHWFMRSKLETETTSGAARFIDKAYLNGDWMFSESVHFILINKTKLIDNDSIDNYFSDAYFNYKTNYAPNPKIPIFKYGSFLDVKVGMLEWYPTYSNIQLMLENPEKFINPPSIYGSSVLSITPLTKDTALNLWVAAHTGDLAYHTVDAELLDAYLNYTKIFKYNLGLSVQAGIAEGSRHVVNYAQALYQPKLENIQFDFRVGKLPTYDHIPYGVHIGLTRAFKYISIGGYYERRMDQDIKGEIAGIQWSIIGPPKVVKVLNTFQIFYDFNTTTLWMWLPIFKVEIQHK